MSQVSVPICTNCLRVLRCCFPPPTQAHTKSLLASTPQLTLCQPQGNLHQAPCVTQPQVNMAGRVQRNRVAAKINVHLKLTQHLFAGTAADTAVAGKASRECCAQAHRYFMGTGWAGGKAVCQASHADRLYSQRTCTPSTPPTVPAAASTRCMLLPPAPLDPGHSCCCCRGGSCSGVT